MAHCPPGEGTPAGPHREARLRWGRKAPGGRAKGRCGAPRRAPTGRQQGTPGPTARDRRTGRLTAPARCTEPARSPAEQRRIPPPPRPRAGRRTAGAGRTRRESRGGEAGAVLPPRAGPERRPARDRWGVGSRSGSALLRLLATPRRRWLGLPG